MKIAVEIPKSLRDYSNERAKLEVSATTVNDALLQLKINHRTLYQSVCDETGAVRRHVNLFVNHEFVPVRDSQGLSTSLKSGDVLTIWTAVSGG